MEYYWSYTEFDQNGAVIRDLQFDYKHDAEDFAYKSGALLFNIELCVG